MAVPFTPIVSFKNGQLRVPLAPLISSALERTFLSADMAVGTAVTVQSQKGFHATTNQPIIIGTLGDETTELVESTTSASPSTITLAASSIFAHYTGDPLYLIKFDKIEFSHSATLAGTKATLTANSGLYSIQPDKEEFILDETEFTSGFYFARFKESVGSTFSDYSDGIEVGVWERDSVGYMINRALHDLELNLSDKMTLFDCYEWVNKGLKFIQGKLKRWPEHYSYNAVLGQAQRGVNVISMPTDAYDRETNKSLVHVRIGDNRNLRYLDPNRFEAQMEGVSTTQTRTAASAGDLTLEIDNSYDFEDSGSVNVYISGTAYNVIYTGVTRSATAGVLTGVPAAGNTGAITVTIPVDTYVWQDENEGIPQWFTVRNSNLEFYPLVDGSEDNANVYGDYAKVATIVDSDGDVIDYQRYDMVQDYLTFRIKMKARNNGELDFNDGYWISFKEGLNDAIRTLPSNNRFPMSPSVNRMHKQPLSRRVADLQQLNINDQ